MAQIFGWKVAHFRPAMTRRGKWVTAVAGDGAGFPDIIAIKPGRRLLVELKAAHGRLTPEQKEWLKSASEAGFEAYCWRPEDIDQIERILRG